MRFINPSLIRRPPKEKEELISRKQAKLLEQRMTDLEATVKTLFADLDRARALQSPSASPLFNLDNQPAWSHSPDINKAFSASVSPRNPFDSEEFMLESAFPSAPSAPVFGSKLRQATNATNGISSDWLNAVEDAFAAPALLSESISDETLNALDAVMADPTVSSVEDRDHLIDVYFDIVQRAIHYRSPFPIVHEAEFRHRMRSGNPPKHVLVLAICALVTFCGSAPDGSRWPIFGLARPEAVTKSEELFEAFLGRINFEAVGVEVIQALIVGKALLIKLNIDPDILEAEDPTGRRWTWLEKETRRRLYAMLVVMDDIDMILRESCFGLNQLENSVKPTAPNHVWHSADPKTGEPTVDPSNYPPVDFSRTSQFAMSMAARIVGFNISSGVVYSSSLRHQADSNNANPFNVTDGQTQRVGGKSTHAQAVAAAGGAVVAVEPARASPEAEFHLIAADLDRFVSALPPEWSMEALEASSAFSMYYDSPPRPSDVPMYWIVLTQMWKNAAIVMLHRPRLIRGLARVVRAEENAGATAAATGGMPTPPSGSGVDVGVGGLKLDTTTTFWGAVQTRLTSADGWIDSFKECMRASVAVTGVMRKRVSFVGPSFLPAPGIVVPVAAICTMTETRPVLEAGLHHLMMAVLLEDIGGGRVKRKDGVDGIPRMPTSLAGFFQSAAGGPAALGVAREGLAIALWVLKGIASRNERATAQYLMLKRLVDGCGIVGLEDILASLSLK
ncbi:hypothetical protein HK101_001294 [Irineochytrium annulatum]|nr:hypothetical protein HK101_001294 [Irineochytrium annulatum]